MCVKENMRSLDDSLDILWSIREFLQSGKSEDEYLHDNSSKENYMNCISKLKEIVQSLRK